MENEEISTRANEPILSTKIEWLLENLVEVVQKEMGTRTGPTALYWHLYNEIQEHVIWSRHLS